MMKTEEMTQMTMAELIPYHIQSIKHTPSLQAGSAFDDYHQQLLVYCELRRTSNMVEFCFSATIKCTTFLSKVAIRQSNRFCLFGR